MTETNMPQKQEKFPESVVLACSSDQIHFSKHDSDVEGGKIPSFSMVAYTGGQMVVPGWSDPVIVNLEGLKIPSQFRPVRFQHSAERGVGHTTSIEVKKGKLLASGVISRATPEAMEIIESAGRGFPWQASISATPEEVEWIDERTTVTVNGKKHKGPLYVVQESFLGEISFVDLGADDLTSVTITAQKKENDMKGALEVGDRNKVPKDEEKDQKHPVVDIKAGAEPKETPKTKPEPSPKDVSDKIEASAKIKASEEESLKNQRTARAEEIRRVEAIAKLCGDNHATIQATAIEKGWSEDRTDLEILRASRPKVAPVTSSEVSSGEAGSVLECAALTAGHYPDVENLFTDKTNQAVHDRFQNGIGLQEVLLEAAWANGFTGRKFEAREVLSFAFAGRGIQAAFSSVDISGILSNIANKFMLAGFESVEGVWRQITAVRSVKDFKTITSYRLVGTEQYEKVAPGGEIQHGDLGEQTFTNKADTYGLMLSVSRTDLINDDLGALTAVPRKLGRGSALKINDLFWTEFMANTGHFKTGNNNFVSGSTTNLGIDGLSTVEQKFMDQTDTEGKPLGLAPAILLVPTALSAISAQLFRSLEIRDTTSSTKIPTANPHSAKFDPLVSRYLGNTNFTGNSQKAWYLLANPADMATIEMVFLNGQESPTIETTEADFAVLGIQMRGFHDFGVKLQDPLAGVKSKGEA